MVHSEEWKVQPLEVLLVQVSLMLIEKTGERRCGCAEDCHFQRDSSRLKKWKRRVTSRLNYIILKLLWMYIQK